MASSPITLYGMALSGHSHRVELFLRLLALPYRFIDAPAPVRESAEFRRMNPLGQIPVLQDGELVLADSNAILVYLARRHAPGCGWLPDEWLAGDAIRKGLRAAARDTRDRALTGYASPQGSLPLRALLARRLAGQGVDAAPDQILLTDSSTHALDLVCRFLVEPGDTVLVDDPCYFNFLALLRAHRVKVVGVAMTPTGPDVTAFAAALTEHRPRFYLTNSAVHNPTGATLVAATAQVLHNGLAILGVTAPRKM